MFNFFKKKKSSNKTKTNKQSGKITDFEPYYLYGFTKKFEQTNNSNIDFQTLYKSVIGNIGGIIIPKAFHPYYIVNKKGLTVWNAAYLKIHFSVNKDEVLNNIKNGCAIYNIDTSSEFSQKNIWPDTRLIRFDKLKENKPFIIPFLIIGNEKPIITSLSKNQELSEINQIVKEIWNQKFEVLGFDKFDENSPSKLIDNFINKL